MIHLQTDITQNEQLITQVGGIVEVGRNETQKHFDDMRSAKCTTR